MTTYELLSLVVQAAGLLFVAASILYAARSFRLAIAVERRSQSEKTLTYASEAMQEMSNSFQYIWKKRQELQSSNYDQSDPELIFHRNLLLNKFEEMAIAVRVGIYDEKLLKDLLASSVFSVAGLLESYILDIRKMHNDASFYEEFESLVSRWKNK
jgi:Domain of unknown function (DUF4760)